jgi:hypothetical protein
MIKLYILLIRDQGRDMLNMEEMFLDLHHYFEYITWQSDF